MSDTRLTRAHDILDRAYAQHDPSHIVVLFSGGDDSLTTYDVTLRWWLNRKSRSQPVSRLRVAHIDTGIAVPQSQDYVRTMCHTERVPLWVYKASENTLADGTPDPQIYEDIVTEHGFPGVGQHGTMYIRLKERQIQRLVRDRKTHYYDRIMLVTGVRRAESDRRAEMVAAEIQRKGAQLWVAPLIAWTKRDCIDYIRDADIFRSPVVTKLHLSGECLCGAFAEKEEYDQLRLWYPDVADRIDDITDRVADAGYFWKWWQSPPPGYRKGQLMLGGGFTPLCVGCHTAKGGAPTT